jgi:transcriptional regulator with XRE-family HTH domain
MAGRKARVTLTDIAAAAHVSVTTASNVANGRLELMSAPTRDRVEAVMRELNYRPDEGARSLRLAQRRAIGLIIVDDSPRFLADPMNTNILAGFSNYLSVNGFGLLLAGIRLAAIDAHLLRRDQTDALCVIPSGAAAERRRLYLRLKETDRAAHSHLPGRRAGLPSRRSLRASGQSSSRRVYRNARDRARGAPSGLSNAVAALARDGGATLSTAS